VPCTITPAIPLPTGIPTTPRPGCDCLIEALALVDPPSAAPGDAVKITLVLTNRGACAYAEATVVALVITGTTYIPDTVTGGAAYDPQIHAIRWEDRFLTQAHPIGYQVGVEPDTARGSLTIPIAIDPRCQHQDPFTVTATLEIAAP
ncbi:MAG: hypothetical protein KJ734_14405, partial [Chloroflexi bacterium]|nr:hypothetical protein [Chloroflexota bacterium]